MAIVERHEGVLGDTLPRDLNRDELILITGAGGFIAGSLVRYFHDLGYTRIRAVDRKPLPEWYQRIPGVESLSLDLSDAANDAKIGKGARAGRSGWLMGQMWS